MKKFLIGGAGAFLSMVLVIAVIGVVYKPKSTAPANVKGGYIKLPGTTIRYYQEGSGPDILMIHGCPGSIEDFDPIVQDLAKNFRVTLYDRPGHGYSEAGDNLYSLNYNARVAEDIIEHLNLKNVLVVGHSYGSGVALSLAISDNANIRAYVLLSAPGYRPVPIDAISYLLGIPYFGKGMAVLLSPHIGPDMVRSKLTAGFAPNEIALTASDLDFRVKLWTQPKW